MVKSKATAIALCATALGLQSFADRVPWVLVRYPGKSVMVVTNDVWAAEAVDVDTEGKTFTLRGFYHGAGVLDLTKIREDTGYSPVRMGNMTWIDTTILTGETAINRRAVTEIIMADEIETTAKQVYRRGENLGRIVCGAGLREIGTEAFGCTGYPSSLSNVVLSSVIEKIGSDAFCDCTNLTTVTPLLPSTLKLVDTNAFCHCPIQGAASIAASQIGQEAFAGNHFSSLTLAEGVTNVANKAFRPCCSIDAYAPFPSTLEELGSQCFDMHDDKTTWTGPSGVADFSACTKLRSLPDQFFYSNRRLREVRLPSGVTNISNRAFRDCRALTNVVSTAATGEILRMMRTADGHLGNEILRDANQVVRFDVPWGGRTAFDASPTPFKTWAGNSSDACALRGVYFFGRAPVPPGTACPQFMTGAGVDWTTRIYVSKKMDKAGWEAVVDHPDVKSGWFGWLNHGSDGDLRHPYMVWWKSPLDPVPGLVLSYK